MPRHVDGWFDHKRRRWVIEYTPVRGGKTYKITRSIRQLRDEFGTDVSDTEIGSLKFWREWWQGKKRELDDLHRPKSRTPLPLEDLAWAQVGHRMPDAPRQGELPPIYENADGTVPEIGDEGVEEFVDAFGDWGLVRIRRARRRGEPIPDDLARNLHPARSQQVESGMDALLGGRPVPTELSLKVAATDYLKFLEGEAAIGKISAPFYKHETRATEMFVMFAGGATPLKEINDHIVHGYYLHLRQRVVDKQAGLPGISRGTAKEYMAGAKRMLDHMVKRGLLASLVSLAETHGFGVTHKTPKVWSADHVARALALSGERLRLWILLALNCGFTQIDIATLRNDHIDLERGYITRKRSKAEAGDYEDAPEVSWKLWPRTRELLARLRSQGELAFLAEQGKALVRQGVGKYRTDVVRMAFDRLKKTLRKDHPDFSLSFKNLRKTSATTLKSHPVHRLLVEHFLGHTPSTVADRHYAAESQKLFDEAVTWLGVQLGLVEPQPE